VSDFVIEHGESARTRRLRHNRLRIALAVAALEGVVVLAGAIPWWVVVLLAAAAVTLYVYLRRRRASSSELVQLAWIAAFSQSALVLVPLVATFLIVLAIFTVAVFAVIALIALARDRR
jgi:hypothetical protein